jgi:hypothetical protein
MARPEKTERPPEPQPRQHEGDVDWTKTPWQIHRKRRGPFARLLHLGRTKGH